MNQLYRCFLVFYCLLPLFPSAQVLDSMLNIYASHYAQEKVYLQLDKQLYQPGETVWFKAYIFSGTGPSALSRNFYAELSDPSGVILQRKVYPITESTAAGNFDLPTDIPGGYLHIRAYTTWMSNFDTAFYFEKNIRVYIGKAGTVPVTAMKRQARLQFFPEGGDLVSGLESMVAFNATDQYGQPVAVNGVIADRAGKALLNFASEHDGMGAFLLPADAGDSLTAVWKDDGGVEYRTALPSARATGVVFKAMPVHQDVLFSVARSEAGDSALSHLTIIGHMHQYMVCRAAVDLSDQIRNSGGIPTGKLPSGVLVLTVFDANMMPLAERAVFINNHDYSFDPQLSVETNGLIPRGKNTLVIDVPDTFRTNLSLSVTDATADGEFPGEDNIVSHLLLTGEVRGYVHDPYYYFSSRSDTLAHLLDLVMMTHGWRRINWEALEHGQVPVIRNPRQDYLALQADLTGVAAEKIGKDESLDVIMRGADSSNRVVQVPHMSGLKFGIMGLVFYDTVTVAYQFNKNHALDRKAGVTFHTGLLPREAAAKPLIPGLNTLTGDTASFSRNNYLKQSQVGADQGNRKAKLLAPAVVTSVEKSRLGEMDQRYTSGIFSGGIMALQYDLVDDRQALSYTSVFQYLEGRVPGLIVYFRPPLGYELSWRGDPPEIFLDEQPVSTDIAAGIPISDIAYVKAFRPGTEVGFSTGFGGSIAIYTKKGNDERDADTHMKGLPTVRLVGYSIPRQFYSPDYLQNPGASQEDLRTTLYWEPYLMTHKDSHRISIDFFNNDISKKLRVVLEGFNQDGKLTHIERIIQ